jgi:Ca2+-binding RTX toxin-like protein
MGATRSRALATSPSAALLSVTRRVPRLVAATVVGLCSLGFTAGPVEAGVILTRETTLVFAGGVISSDTPDLSRHVTATESGGRLIVTSAGDPIDTDAVRCPYVEPSNPDTVTCDLNGIVDLNILTGNGNDQVAINTALPTVLCGGRGNDDLFGGAGEDILAGAAGDDSLYGAGAQDFLRADRVPGFAETDPTCSAAAADTPGMNALQGGDGSDLLVGDDGRDTMRGGSDSDFLFGRPGDDELHGEEGDDLLVGLDGADAIHGGPGTDVLSGGSGADGLDGGSDSDDVGVPILLTVDRGGPVEASIEYDNDDMQGGDGDDTLFAGPGDRTVNYGLDLPQRASGRAEPNGADRLSGGAGLDHVTYFNREIPVSMSLDGHPNDGAVGEGDDISSDVERLTGGARDDTLSGGEGNDVLDGGPGSDAMAGLDGADSLEGGQSDEGADVLAGGVGPDTLSAGPGVDALSGGDGGDTLRGGGGTDRLDGNAGDDDIQGEADADVLVGGAGADVLDGGQGVDRVDYSDVAGSVTVTLDGVRNDGERREDWVRRAENVRGGAGADSLFGDAGVNAIAGGPGHDIVDAAKGADRVSAGPGHDAVLARDDARDAIACGTGKDVAVADELDALGRGAELCERADRGGGARRGEALLRPACRLGVRLADAPRVLLLAQTLSIPRGTLIDTRRCPATLSGGRRAPRVRAEGGRFILRLAGTRQKPLSLTLVGPPFSVCRASPPSRAVRTLSVGAHGRVSLAARYAVSAGRGARWKVEDRCGSTVTRVRRGQVRVIDRGLRRAVTVRAGQVHISRPGRAPGR